MLNKFKVGDRIRYKQELRPTALTRYGEGTGKALLTKDFIVDEESVRANHPGPYLDWSGCGFRGWISFKEFDVIRKKTVVIRRKKHEDD